MMAMLDNAGSGETHAMKFMNPVFEHEKLNATVRNGAQWANRLKIGDRIEWGGEGNVRYGRAEVVGLLYDWLKDIPAQFHRFNHDPACRTKANITAELNRIYGDATFPGRKVTMIFFRLESAA